MLRTFARQIIPLFILIGLLAVSVWAQSTGYLSGTVQDAQGAALAGAKIIVSDPARNLQLEAVTNSDGTFSFTSLQPSTYSVTVEANGFRKYVQTGIVINASDRQSTGVIKLEVGALTGESVQVVADAAQLQIKTESGEQSTAINNQQLQNLAVNGRNYLDLLKLTPGVVVTTGFATSGPGGLGNINVNGGRGGKNNLTIDGTTNVDTGSNGTQHIALSLDNIAEFKVLSSNYQAEYGRSAGAEIQIITKSGTSQFHGTGYYFHRHEQFNANNWYNNANGRNAAGIENNPRNFYRYNQQGYNIGGPVYIPKLMEKTKDKLFFFWSQEWQQQLVPRGASSARVPTAAELSGDFSNTYDGNGVKIYIRDPTKTGTCSATDQTACFPGNIIPASRINPNGTKILNLFRKFENIPLNPTGINGYRYNHNSQQSISYPRSENSIRLDYNMSEKTRAYIRYTRDTDQQIMPYGLGWTGGNNNIPFDNLIFKQAPAWNGTLNVTNTLSPTMTNEFIFGASQNNLTLNPSVANAASYSGIGFNFATPFPYPADQWFNITFGGIPNTTFAGVTGYSQFPYKNSNTTFDIYDNFSKVLNTHTVKAGFYYQRSRKDQAAGNSAAMNFSHNVNDPNNAQHPFANALLGNFNTYSQPNIGVFQGQYRSTNVEFYLQDNWKATSRLTLDYGMRFSLIYPQYDARQQDYYFVPEKWNSAQAVRLYRPTCVAGTFRDNNWCTSSANQRAYDPANPTALLPAFLVNRIVPGSGNAFNGQQGTKDGYLPGGIKSRGVQYGPAVGFAYDVFGNKKTVLRGGYRFAYDRVQGNELVFAAVGQPPLFINPTFNFGNLSNLGSGSGPVALGPVSVIGADPEGKVPSIQSFSLQVQQDLGRSTVISVGYVGTLGRHQQEILNINYSPYGELFTKAAQDPSRYANGIVPDVEPGLAQVYIDAGVKFSGQNALQAVLLKRYPGYDTVGMRTFGGSSNYHSMQATLSQRLGRSFNLGVAYTWSKTMGTSNGYTDGINPICSRCADYKLLSFDRTHLAVINYDWRVPGLKDAFWLVKGFTNGWQFTGITQFASGSPTQAGIGIQNINLNQRIAGSWNLGVNALLTGDVKRSSDPNNAFNWQNVRLPSVAEALALKGNFPRTYLRNPGTNVTDLSVFKNFSLGGSDDQRKLQLRVEAFNVFNHAQFSSFSNGVTFNIAQNFSDFLTRQKADASYVQNVRGTTLQGNPRLGGGLGEYNGLSGSVSANRIIQLAVKIFF